MWYDRSGIAAFAPPAEKFISRVRALGVGAGPQVVVYDGIGVFSAARVWWLFRLMGKSDVAVLDGGFPKWQADGHAVIARQDIALPATPQHGVAATHQEPVAGVLRGIPRVAVRRVVDSLHPPLVATVGHIQQPPPLAPFCAHLR